MLAASAAQPPVGLGTAASFAVLAGTTVTNTGPSTISGDLGVSPGTAITGFPPGKVINGTQHAADAVALQAQSDLTTAYKDAAGRIPATTVSKDLGGQTLAPGVYKATSGLGLTGTLTLNAQNNPSAVFVFQAGSTLITASSSTVKLTGGAEACNVFWQVGSSATLGTNSTFVGSILALTSATAQTGTTVEGRVLARNGQVSLDDNTITLPTCAAATTTTTSASTTTTTSASTTTTTSASTTTTTSPTTTTTSPTTTTTSPTTTTTSASTTTTTPGVPPTTVPPSHTGEPWAGWPYWALVGIAGFLGLAFMGRAVAIRRRRA
ncbi:MAG: ice-binding family protein [Acidimicrobiales bacterium]